MASRQQTEELIAIMKTYDFILWSCHHTGKFPPQPQVCAGRNELNETCTISWKS